MTTPPERPVAYAPTSKPALSVTSLRVLAEQLRHRADNPVPATLGPAWLAGFCDGYRSSADVLDALCDETERRYRADPSLSTESADAPPGPPR